MMGHAKHAASSDVATRATLLHAAVRLARRLEAISAQHGDQKEVVTVCDKWAHRLLALERQAIDAGIAA